MRLLWLPDVLRAAGLTVHEVAGWRTRGSDSFDPRGIICHATAGSRNSTDAGEIRVLLNGSTSAPPPIAQLYLGRNGHWHVVASGRCNHALVGWGGPLKGYGNSHLIGVEAANDNRGEPWPAVQVDSYQRGVAAICRRMGWSEHRVAGHREHQPGAKTDPFGIDMDKFRARVAALLVGKDDDMTPEQESQVIAGELTPRNVLHYRLRAIQDSQDPELKKRYPKWPVAAPGLRQIGERLERLEQAVAQLATQQAPQLDYDRLAEALLRRLARG